MDFSKVDITKILKSGMANKFMDFSPQDFEDFIAQLFRNNGYEVQQTKYSGDYGVDAIIKKDNESIAVQVKRYASDNKVGVQDVNQVIGGRDFYKCNKARIITTSSFTNQVKKLSESTGVELWDWNVLQKYLCNTYLDGKDYYEYFKDKTSDVNDLDFEISQVIYNQLMKGNFTGTLITVKIQNLTDKNYDTYVALPTYITSENNQVEARYHLDGYFRSGTIYAGCTVESCFIFESERVPRVKIGDTMVLDVTYSDKNTKKTINIDRDFSPRTNKSGCFIATAAYGNPFSQEIDLLRRWRDQELSNNIAGRAFVWGYYSVSPPIADFIRHNDLLREWVRSILYPFVKHLKKKYQEEDEKIMRISTTEFNANLPSIVRRTKQLDCIKLTAMPYQQVESFLIETTRCYIEGHFLATIILCRALLEGALKDRLKLNRKLESLIDVATPQLLDKRLAKKAHKIRQLGNWHVHVKSEKMIARPIIFGESEAHESLEAVREILVKLYPPRS